MRKSAAQRIQNKSYKTRLKNITKKVRAEKDSKEASAALKEAFSVIDKCCKRGVIHKNKAARRKSNLSCHVQSLAS